jgi:hypothetical protein
VHAEIVLSLWWGEGVGKMRMPKLCFLFGGGEGVGMMRMPKLLFLSGEGGGVGVMCMLTSPSEANILMSF